MEDRGEMKKSEEREAVCQKKKMGPSRANNEYPCGDLSRVNLVKLFDSSFFFGILAAWYPQLIPYSFSKSRS